MTAYIERLARSIDTYLGRRLPPMHCADRLEPRRDEIEREVGDAVAELTRTMESGE